MATTIRYLRFIEFKGPLQLDIYVLLSLKGHYN